MDQIRNDARSEADRITRESATKAEKIKEESRAQAVAAASDLMREAELEAGLEAGRIITQARLETKIAILAARKKLAAEVLEKAFQKRYLDRGTLRRKVVLKDGEKEEPLDPASLLEEVGPELENMILTILNI